MANVAVSRPTHVAACRPSRPPFAIPDASAYYPRGRNSSGVANVIQSVEIKNLRGIREGKLDGLTALTILVGPNGCGKSTILDALFLVSSALSE